MSSNSRWINAWPGKNEIPLEHRVRNSDPSTSVKTAMTLGKQTGVRYKVYEQHKLHDRGLTDFELDALWKTEYPDHYTAESTVRKRRCELVEMGYLEPRLNLDGSTSERKFRGQSRIVWGLPTGRLF